MLDRLALRFKDGKFLLTRTFGIEYIPIIGSFTIKHFNKEGVLLEEREVKNLIVNVGIALVAGLVDGSQTLYINAMAVGTGTTAAAVTDTALGTEVMRVATSNALVTTSVANDTAQFTGTFNFTASYAITEEGLFNSTTASSGVMLSHQVFAAINVVSGDSIQFVHKIQF
jgi:hypothetical protein